MFGLDGEKQGKTDESWSEADTYMTQATIALNTDKTQGSEF